MKMSSFEWKIPLDLPKEFHERLCAFNNFLLKMYFFVSIDKQTMWYLTSFGSITPLSLSLWISRIFRSFLIWNKEKIVCGLSFKTKLRLQNISAKSEKYLGGKGGLQCWVQEGQICKNAYQSNLERAADEQRTATAPKRTATKFSLIA